MNDDAHPLTPPPEKLRERRTETHATSLPTSPSLRPLETSAWGLENIFNDPFTSVKSAVEASDFEKVNQLQKRSATISRVHSPPVSLKVIVLNASELIPTDPL